jgi:hypothetical protein
MSGAMTNAELIAARTQGRSSKTYLLVSRPALVFSCRVNQTFDSLDGVVEVTYDGAVGDYANVLPGMTLYVGSSAGLYDVGLTRIRKAPTDTRIYFAKSSDIAWQDELYLSVMVDFYICARQPGSLAGIIKMDEDIEFSQAGYGSPVVLMGPPVKILEMNPAASVSHSPDASDSYSPIDATISSFQWYAPDASATEDMDTATPLITYNTAGEKLEYCVVTDENGGSSIGYRKRFVDPDPAQVTLVPGECGVDVDSGGWNFSITGYSGVGLTDLRDRALVVIWKKDYIGARRAEPLGPLAGYENIRAVGWVDGESIELNVDSAKAKASFTVHGPAFWLNQIDGYPMSVLDKPAEMATNWEQFPELTVDRALYRLIHWQTTLDSITDVVMTGDTRRIPFANVNSATLWGQITSLAKRILAAPLCDRFGRVFIEIPTSLLPTAERASVPTILDIGAGDWYDKPNLERVTISAKSQMEISGNSVWDGATSQELVGRAPGNNPEQYGSPEAPYSDLVFVDQDDCNRLAGDLLAHENNEYPNIEIPIWIDTDFIDICPRQRVCLSIAEADTPRGIIWTNKQLTPLAITLNESPKTGKVTTSLVCEAETSGEAGVTIMPPQPIMDGLSDNYIPNLDEVPSYPTVPAASTWFPLHVPGKSGSPSGTCYDVANGPFALAWDKYFIKGDDSVLTSRANFPCKIRPVSFGNKTQLQVSIRWAENVSAEAIADAKSHFHCYAIDSSGNHVLTGTVTPGDNEFFPTLIDFEPLSDMDVAGFEIVLDAGNGPGAHWEPGALIASGTVNASDDRAEISGLVVGGYYVVEAFGGPWRGYGGILTSYQFGLNISGGTGQTKLGWTSDMGIGMDLRVFADGLAAGISSAEAIDAYYARAYFSPPSLPIYLTVGQSYFNPRSGSISYKLRERILAGVRSCALGTGKLYNVCAAGD